MTPSDLQALVQRHASDLATAPVLSAAPPAPVAPDAPDVAATPAGTGEGGPLGVVTAIVANLTQVLDHAERSHLNAVDVYADTLLVPAGFDRRLDGSVRRLTIAARRIVTEGSASLRMVHAGDGVLSAVRLFADEVDPRLALFGGPDGQQAYDLAALAAPAAVPRFLNFRWDQGAPSVRESPVPPGLLAYGEPLHQVLSALYALCAALLGRPGCTEQEHALCRELLGWVLRWSGVDVPFGDLIRAAGALRAVVPQADAAGVLRPLPPLTAERSIALARADLEVMAALEADLRAVESGSDIAHLAGGIVGGFADRDDADLERITAQVHELEERLGLQIEALDTAARTLRREEYESDLAQIELQLQTALARIDRIAMLVFQITVAVVEVAGSVAGLCVGVPPNPNAVTEQGLKGVKGVGDMVTQAKTLGHDMHGVLDALTAISKSWLIPFKWAKDNADVLKGFVDPAKSVWKAVLPVVSGPLHGTDATVLGTQLGTAMRLLAQAPDAAAAQAEWTALEVDLCNQLDLVLQDAEGEQAVKKAASAYKTRIQRMAVYGRLLAEQAAAKAALARELAALKLDYLAAATKKQRLVTLAQALAGDVDHRQVLAAELRLRAAGVARGFFASCYGARAAQRYETGVAPMRTLAYAPTQAGMAQALALLQADHAAACAAGDRSDGRFFRELCIDDPRQLAALSAGQPLAVEIDLQTVALLRFRHTRLTVVRAWLELATPTSQAVAVSLVSGSVFQDRRAGGAERYTTAPLTIRFEHRGARIEYEQTLHGVMPTPFTRWIVDVVEPRPLPSAVRALRLQLEGQALVQ
ncbi:hypothetical protein ACPOLB_08960 [Rubrivivax sp. RP6-9]|uniref:hypothetical protein n=1 Tax=Rubrivivax sp. RP6-9 TaxID=3415750 RepID=UPI003CC59C99